MQVFKLEIINNTDKEINLETINEALKSQGFQFGNWVTNEHKESPLVESFIVLEKTEEEQ